jgi:hypothetical protein
MKELRPDINLTIKLWPAGNCAVNLILPHILILLSDILPALRDCGKIKSARYPPLIFL